MQRQIDVRAHADIWRTKTFSVSLSGCARYDVSDFCPQAQGRIDCIGLYDFRDGGAQRNAPWPEHHIEQQTFIGRHPSATGPIE